VRTLGFIEFHLDFPSMCFKFELCLNKDEGYRENRQTTSSFCWASTQPTKSTGSPPPFSTADLLKPPAHLAFQPTSPRTTNPADLLSPPGGSHESAGAPVVFLLPSGDARAPHDSDQCAPAPSSPAPPWMSVACLWARMPKIAAVRLHLKP
jgi:hypothetical protein